MNFEVAAQQITSMKRSLNRAKASALVEPQDPALLELERILAGKSEALDNAKRNSDFERVFFADIEDETPEVRRFR